METVTAKTSLLGNILKILPVARTIYCMVPFMYFNRVSVAQPRVFNFFKAVRDQESDLPVGAAGFCWGGLYTFKLAADAEKTTSGKSLIDAGFTAHPSMLTIPQDAEAIKLPISVAIGDADMALAHEKSLEAKKVIESKGAQHEYVIIPGAKHGFAIRNNPNNKEEVKQGLQAEDQAVEWFKKKLGI
ncbi:MAG: hypothetical protein MMC23_006900 [Stictis urceolatum]|nr:hypothetical protein [Stictis urceolata]